MVDSAHGIATNVWSSIGWLIATTVVLLLRRLGLLFFEIFRLILAECVLMVTEFVTDMLLAFRGVDCPGILIVFVLDMDELPVLSRVMVDLLADRRFIIGVGDVEKGPRVNILQLEEITEDTACQRDSQTSKLAGRREDGYTVRKFSERL
jgi:hypothetical protein